MRCAGRRSEAAVKLIDVGDRQVAYHRAGEGPPLVLLHGGWSDGRAWRPQLAGLADAFDVIAWDAPGCGASEDPPSGMTLADYADVAAGLLAALGVERAHLCGLSWGGGLALAMYQRHQSLVRALVLAGAYAGWKGSFPAEEVEARMRRARAEAERPPAEWMDGYLPSFFSGPAPSEALELVQMMMLDVRPAGSLPMLTAFADADLSEVLPTIAVPTLLLYGERDARSPLPVARALHRAIPGSELVVLPGVGHYVNLAAPDAFDAEVRRFLTSAVM
jgi:pimeloyl-ACP methyl ester carboxylesterase